MSEKYDRAELSFTNPIITDILGRYADNSVMAGIIGSDGVMRMKFRLESDLGPVNTCEQVLSLLFALLESNPDSPIGKVYMQNRCEIMRETLLRLNTVLDGFSRAEVLYIQAIPGTDKYKQTKYSIKRTKTKNTTE